MSFHKPIRVYKASAGSGKTYTLAAEFIANMLSDYGRVAHVHGRQLAITFTKKATGEMKERILQNLWLLAHAEAEELIAAVQERLRVALSVSQIRQRAKALLTQILHHYDGFHVTTIDSFFQSLLSNVAYEVGLSASFKIDLGDSDVLSKGVDRFLRALNEGNRQEELQWLSAYMQEKFDDAKSWRIQEELKKLSQELLKEPYLMDGDEVDSLSNEKIEHFRKTLRQRETAIKNKLKTQAATIDAFIVQTQGYGKISNGERVLKSRLLRYAEWNFTIESQKYFTEKFLQSLTDPIALLKKTDQKKAELVFWATELGNRLLPFVEALEKAHHELNSISLSLQHLNPLRLLGSINEQVRCINHENNRFMLAHTPSLFDKMISKDVASFVFERAGTQFDHVMIDEFQDTSTLQWRNLQHLITENIAAGKTCLLVGDVKQGIYRWRGGDWTSLSRLRNDEQSEIKSLRHNFRSGTEIVAFNNHIFSKAATLLDAQQEEDDENADAVKNIYTPQWRETAPDSEQEERDTVEQIARKAGGFVRVRIVEAQTSAKNAPPDDEQEEDEQALSSVALADLAQQMERLHQMGIPYQKMAILVRWNKEAQQILQHEAFANIPLVSDEAFLLSSSEVVQIIVRCLQLVASGKKQNKPTDTNSPTSSAETEEDFAFANTMALQYLKMRSPEGEWDRIYAYLKNWTQRQHEDLPFYQRILQIVKLFRLNQNAVTLTGDVQAATASNSSVCRNHATQSAYLYAFLDHVLEFLDDDVPEIHRFLNYWRDTLSKKSIPSTSAEGVNIVTVHKSKGLDFHTLFVPFCNWELEKDDQRNFHWINWEEKMRTLDPEQQKYCAEFAQLSLLPISHNGKTANSIYATEYAKEHCNQRIENLNLLYVAFTRPRQNLVVCAERSHQSKKNSTSRLKNCGDLLHSIIAPMAKTAGTSENALQVLYYDTDTAQDVETDYAVEWGQPSLLECGESGQSNESKNPLVYTAEEEYLLFSLQNAKIRFRQSNVAKEFYAAAGMKNNTETTSSIAEPQCEAITTETQWQERRLAAQRMGNLVHLVMEQIETHEDVEQVLAELPQLLQQKANRTLYPEHYDSQDLRRLLEARLRHPQAQSWFDGTSYKLYREYAILSRNAEGVAQSRRPDRVMIAPDRSEAIVLDYKTGERDQKNEMQVREYCRLLRQMGIAQVRGYLWYLFEGKNEIVEVGV